MDLWQPLVATLSQAANAVADLPASAHGAAVGALLSGLALWLFGKKLLKPAFVLIGVCVGGLLGFLLVPSIVGPTVFGAPSPYVGLGVGAVLGLVQAIALFRFAMAVSAGLIVALAATLVAAAWMNFQPLSRIARAADQPVATFSPLTPSGESAAPADARGTVVEQMRPVAQRVEAFAEEVGGQIKTEWARLSAGQQTTLVLAMVGGALAGLVGGLLFPGRASAAVTALAGSAIWLPAAVWLAHAYDAPGHEHLRMRALAWLIVWAVVAAGGVALQWTLVGKKKG